MNTATKEQNIYLATKTHKQQQKRSRSLGITSKSVPRAYLTMLNAPRSFLFSGFTNNHNQANRSHETDYQLCKSTQLTGAQIAKNGAYMNNLRNKCNLKL